MSIIDAESVNGSGFTLVCGFPLGANPTISQDDLDDLCDEIASVLDRYGMEVVMIMDNEFTVKFFWKMGQKQIEKALLDALDGGCL